MVSRVRTLSGVAERAASGRMLCGVVADAGPAPSWRCLSSPLRLRRPQRPGHGEVTALGIQRSGHRPDERLHSGFACERDPAGSAAEVRRDRRGRADAAGLESDTASRRRAEGGLLGRQRGANTIGGSQIGALFKSINGLHANLSGYQIRFMARMPIVAAIVPNETVQMSSVGSRLESAEVGVDVGAPVDWMPKATQLSAPTIAIVDSGIDPPC